MAESIALSIFFGLVGNIVSILLFLAPVPTFHQIYQRKSTENFPSMPYSLALFTSNLYLYYGFLKQDRVVLTINSIGSILEITYLIVFIVYATKEAKAFTLKVLVLLNAAGLGFVFGISTVLHVEVRVNTVGWIGAVFSICVFVAPLGVMRRVISTKSVEYMSILMSFLLTLGAILWFCYGFLIDDYFIAGPNVVGFALGSTQIVVYVIYKDRKDDNLPELPESDGQAQEDQGSTENQPNMEHELEIIISPSIEQVLDAIEGFFAEY